MIRRARKRPRKHSCAWKSLGWVIWRQAVLQIVHPTLTWQEGDTRTRYIAHAERRILVPLVARILQRDPDRRFTP